MEFETIKLNKSLVENIRTLVRKTKLFRDETDFIEQAIIKQMSKMRDY
jgi:Arc/MetJ-type ribon-helix-helix transcriptional regulator